MIKLVSPRTGESIHCEDGKFFTKSGEQFKEINGALRIVLDSNYTDNFGFQWNLFQEVQIDDLSGSGVTAERFFKATKWDKSELKDLIMLEAGCGAGRFTSVVLKETEAKLYSFDYSNSVEANFKNNGPHDRLLLFQASIYEMPFSGDSFDRIFCFGVLQFTPNPKEAVKSLIEVLKPGGRLVVDFFPKKGWWTRIHAKYMLRPFTSRMDHAKLLSLIKSNIGWLMKVYGFFSKLGLNKAVNRFLPICDIDNTIPKGLTKDQVRQWAILDTFNMLSPRYDNPLRMRDAENWFKEFGLIEVVGEEVRYSDRNSVQVVRGIKPS